MPNSKYYKEFVGKCQIYRRVANVVRNTLQDIEVHIHSNKASTSVQKNAPCHSNFDLKSNDLFIIDQDNVHKDPVINIGDICNDSNFEQTNYNNEISHYISSEISEGFSNLKQDTIGNHENTFLNCNINTIYNRKKVPHSVINDLFISLSPLHPSLPLNSRTLLRTPRYNIGFKKLDTGDLCYFGIGEYLKRFLSISDVDIIRLSFNIDGLPLYHSSSIQFWPILGLIRNHSGTFSPFTIAVFCGKMKPSPLSSYFEDFITELLLTIGLMFNGKKYIIEVQNFICDAPARAFVKCVKSHGGYSACDKCTEEGEYINGRMIYEGISASKRTDESFLLH